MTQLKYLPISLIAILFFTACKKDPAFTAGGNGTTNVSSCLMSSDYSDQSSIGANQFDLTYDASGQMSSVVISSTGTQVGTESFTAQEILRKQGAKTETFDFTKNIFTGQPDSYTYANSDNASLNKTIKLSYNGSQVTQAQVKDATDTASILISFTYDASKDVKSIAIGNGGSTTTYTATSYDDKNSPFYGQPGSNLLFYSWDYNNVSYSDLFNRLSRHNVIAWTLTYPTGSTTAGYSYTYNPQGYPLTVLQSTQSSDNGTTYPISYANWTYTYNCK